ncbi:PDZ domain-containing protein [Streptomyces sp. NBC_01136]|uniref:PDZ domain-containing protein n=1 Tax=unclassified Streptomyces TaxID=2593676 RepID=UPI00324AF4F6|nr:PDZ domain-containing protein [Streptomyces sp. NBC_01136]
MEQTALRPKPMPGQDPGGGHPSDSTRGPLAARRRGKQLLSLLFGFVVGMVLVLSGVGLGTVGATVIGLSKLADLQKQVGAAQGPSGGSSHPGQPSGAPPDGGTKSASGGESSTPSIAPRPAPEKPTLGIEAVDAPGGGGALVVGVHIPGPGCTAGLVRGDTLFAFGGTRLGSAADLARAVLAAAPGTTVTLGVRHANGNHQQLSTIPGIVT